MPIWLACALARIEAGSTAIADFERVGDRWDLPVRFAFELQRHGLGHLTADIPAVNLSGGEAMRVALLGAMLTNSDFIILDEPTNHLDRQSRQALLQQLRSWSRGLLTISHARQLLDEMAAIVEVSASGLNSYGGNYAFYAERKALERESAQQELDRCRIEKQRTERALRVQQERQARRQSQGSRHGREANQAKILLDR